MTKGTPSPVSATVHSSMDSSSPAEDAFARTACRPSRAASAPTTASNAWHWGRRLGISSIRPPAGDGKYDADAGHPPDPGGRAGDEQFWHGVSTRLRAGAALGTRAGAQRAGLLRRTRRAE